MKSIENTQKEVIENIQNLHFEGSPQNLYEPLNYILSIGGKRIRPLLCVLICDIMNGNKEAALKAGQAVEVFHNFSLIHDDIMDGADVRRNKATVHKKWNVSNAILSGDLMLVKAYEIMLELPDDSKIECLKMLLDTSKKVCEGQQFDMNFETENHIEMQQYIEMIKLKTAVLLGCSLWCGTYIATQDKSLANKLYEFGCLVGIGFQIWDDYLDTFGETAQVGKRIGGDIIANKKTYLLIKALELADEIDAKIINELYNTTSENETEKIITITKLFQKLEVDKIAKAEMENYFQKANAILATIPNYNFEPLQSNIKGLQNRNH